MRGAELPLLIGYAEVVDLPDFGVHGLVAKTDTGARTSALHVESIEEIGGGLVRFQVRLHRRDSTRLCEVVCPIVRYARVRGTTGGTETRVVVRTRLTLGSVEKEIEVTLASRGEMIHRMLLGRQALGRDLVIDASRRYVVGRPRKKKRSKRAGKKRRRAT